MLLLQFRGLPWAAVLSNSLISFVANEADAPFGRPSRLPSIELTWGGLLLLFIFFWAGMASTASIPLSCRPLSFPGPCLPFSARALEVKWRFCALFVMCKHSTIQYSPTFPPLELPLRRQPGAGCLCPRRSPATNHSRGTSDPTAGLRFTKDWCLAMRLSAGISRHEVSFLP